MDRPERHHRRDRRAIGIGDDAFVVGNAAGVDLGHHQRHVRVHAEGGAVVHHHGAGLHRQRRIMFGNAAARREQRDIHALERIVGQFLDDEVLAAERRGLAGRARAGQKLQRFHLDPPAFNTADEFTAHRAGGAHNRYVSVLHLSSLSAIKKAPFCGALASASFVIFQSRARAQAPTGLVLVVMVVVLRVVMGREPMGRDLFRQRLQPRHMAHFPAGPGLALAVEMDCA